MRSRRLTWILAGLLCLAGVCLLWQGRDGWLSRPHRPHEAAAPPMVTTVHSLSTAPQFLVASTNATPGGTISAATNKFAYRLSNTAKSLDQLMRDDRAILLENALIDTRNPLNLSIPANLRAQGDPGAYIVQSRGPVDAAFRAMLKASGATIVSYIPNNAYLVRAPAGVANGLGANPLAQSVIPYEPYYKISSSMPVTVGQRTFSATPMGTNRAAGPSLLTLAVKQAPLPAGTYLTLGLFSDNAAATIQQIEKLGGQIVAQDSSPFGPIVRVQPPRNWTALAALPGVQIVEPYHQRVRVNDLSRVTVGVSTNTLVSSNYMNLTGKNVIVEVNDTGIDANHPDFTATGNAANGPSGLTRVIGDAPQSLVDTNGHGTHVAGIIAGNGAMSINPVNVGAVASGSVTNADFRGKAPLAMLYSVAAIDNTFTFMNVSDQYLQEAAALTNALISNNSWDYAGNGTYDLAAASYDAAVRDALPEVTGSQPVLFVFSAGNDGNGDNGGFNGNPDTILSPATAKNVITVGALEQLRNITNIVTALDGSSNAVWQPMTDSSNQVAGYSSRGNVGIGIEGTYGRFKPDVVAPGTFVVSTRSEQWDTNAYYNPTNYNLTGFSDVVDPSSKNFYSLVIPQNIVQLTIQLEPNIASPSPFPSLPILVWNGTSPRTSPPYQTGAGSIALPPLAITPVKATWEYAISNNTSESVNYDVLVDIVTTNDLGNYYQILQGMNDSLGTSPEYYRYETGTSMSAADVSGVLALMQDFFTNQWQTLPSPALLKAMLINGARSEPDYDLQVNNSINFQGWGLINLTNALQPGITNQLNVPCSAYLQDQNPTNALATGDSQTFYVSVTNVQAQQQPLRITLAWTDPPGDPAAAIKLVNDLNLVVTNLDNPTNPIVYYGNDIPTGNTFNSARTTNSPPNFDSINNVENVYITPLLGTNYSVTVMGYRVNVNAVTAQTNNFAGAYAPNVVQDYALVISSGNGLVTNAMTVTTNSTSFVSHPTSDQQITYVTATNQPLLNQFVGANTPLMGTNALLLTNSISVNGETNEQITIGMTNQWHFYVVTNTTGFTNAAFVTFIPDTLSISRMGVFADSQANATRPQADIDLYVTTDSNLLTLNPTSIYAAATNYLASVSGPSPNVFATMPAGIFEMASLGRGGTEYVVDTNSQPNEVYYIGVKSEDQMASEYGFIPIFSATPFSQMNTNGNEIVTGNPVPALIPDGSPANPSYAYVFGIAIYPIDVRRVVVTNQVWHQNFGDLMGTLTLNGGNLDVLNNHDSLGNTVNWAPFVYDDSGQGDIVDPLRPSPRSDGPGSLNGFIGQKGNGVWMLTESDNSLTQTGAVENFSLTIQPHLANNGATITATVAGNTWFYDYIDVPPGATNLTITVTNLTGTASPPLELFVNGPNDGEPTLTSSDKGPVPIDTGTPFFTNSISIGPPLTAGRYFYGVFNPSATPQTVSITATYYTGAAPGQFDYTSTGPVPIKDDAVTTSTIPVPDNATIYSVDVGLRVDHPRISDLVFHLISPDGTRVLLVENRGGTSTNGCGSSYNATNTTASAAGGPGSYTNTFNTGYTSGTLAIDYTFYNVQNEMEVYYEGAPIGDTGLVIGSGVLSVSYGPGTSTQVEIVINPANNLDPSISWAYAANETVSQYSYLVLTENTNLTTTPIKFAPPPFIPTSISTNAAPPIPTNVVVVGGPIFNPAKNGYAYYLLGTNTWTGSEAWATNLGGHLVTIRNAAEQNWVYDTFSAYGGIGHNLWIGLYDTNLDANCSPYTDSCHSNNFGWVSGEPVTYTDWSPGPPSEPNNCNGSEYYTFIWGWGVGGGAGNAGDWNDEDNAAEDCSDTSIIYPTYGVVEVTNLNSSIISPDLYYLPEQSLDTFAHKNAYGTWTLEIQDDRAGASNNATLVSWQLRFTYTTASGTLNNVPPQTNNIPAGGIVYYLIRVPPTAGFPTPANSATNMLFATGPLNLWFNETTPPSGTGSPGDYLLLNGVTNGSSVLSRSSSPTNIVDGGSYWLAVQNTGTSNITYGIEVDFDVPGGSTHSSFSISAANITSSGAQLQWVAPPGDRFQVEWATNLSQPMVWMTNDVILTSTNGTFTFTDPGATNSPMRFYRLLRVQ